ncbi:MAG: recombinase family protein [Desulfatitalea sp.]|nr:recombinase family protein [Desulfatitalea sp.]NNK02091.1 recombinase family protein [Desulfatitalea sp.]
MTMAAIYARVSSDRQKQEHTIDSQIAALSEFAHSQALMVPEQWVFQDEGYSGATVVRPALERLRDLACEGTLEAILVYSPDRLSRKYAYQVLLVEEFSRQGVEVIFIKSPKASTPEEQLLVQFQGMIAEYERAQIAERTRRGKRFRARSGSVNVLSGAPYGYRYIKKTEIRAAYYQVIEEEAEVVRTVYKLYTEDNLSINAIARWLNDHQIPTRKRISLWERSTVWAMLRNPAYKGMACFGKTRSVERKKITRPLRKRGGFSPRDSAHKECPQEQWLQIPVPALISEDLFALAQERLQSNKRHSPRRTIEPTLLQGMLVCNNCGYAYYRTSTRTSKRKLYYYRCLGSDNYRFSSGPVCQSRPIRQDYLDELVWKQIVVLLSDPELVRSEIRRRIEMIQESNSEKQRREVILKELLRVENSIKKLLDAYQSDLLQMDELRDRMPQLRNRHKTLQAELAGLEYAVANQQSVLRLANKLESFLRKLCKSAETMDILERQRVLRLVVKEILVDDKNIRIKHSVPLLPSNKPGGPKMQSEVQSYLLRSGRHQPTFGKLVSALCI